MLPKRRLLLVGLIVVPLFLTAASPGQTSVAGLDTLIVAVPGTVELIDPNYAAGSFSSQTVVANVYDQLTEYESRMTPGGYLVDNTEKIVGAVAKSVSMPLGSKQVVYHIRDGLKFHDGTPLDAKAVKFTFDRIVSLKGTAYGFLDQAGARTSASFEALDNESFVARLQQPNLLTLKLFTAHNIVPINPKLIQKHATADDPYARNWLALNEAGSGPFMLEKLSPASEVVLVRYDNYWKGPAKFKRVIMKVIPSVADRVLALERGSLDMITEVPPKNIASVQKNPSVKVFSVPSRKMFPLGMNVNIPPFNNVKVRQAICYAIPYDTVIKEAFRGYASRLRSGIVKGTPTHTEKFGYETDLDKAKALLAEAGFSSGFKTTLSIRAGFEEDEEAAVWIKSNLQKIGITSDIETLPFGAFITKARAKEHQMYITAHSFWVNDPFYTYYFLHRTGAPSNFTGYSSKEVDDLIAEFMTSPNLAARAKASEQIQQIVMKDAPFCYLAQANVNVAMRKNVSGYYFYFDGANATRFYTMYKTP
jgi:peptide/nickel transport system substrate-binding protein